MNENELTPELKLVRSKSKVRNARLLAEAVEILCPYCGGTFPYTDGSMFWTVVELQLHQGIKKCVECDEEFRVAVFDKVNVK